MGPSADGARPHRQRSRYDIEEEACSSRRWSIVLTIAATTLAHAQTDVFDRVKHGYAESQGGVKIHYASLGERGRHAPLVVMIHGFPDFWYSWRHQMEALSDRFQVVAIDQRGYNLSDKPKGVENYDMRLLVGDVAAVIRHLERDKATIVGHDWGGVVAWQFAMNLPQMTENLIILNLPHPNGLLRELRSNPEQNKNSEYARNFQTKSQRSDGLLREADDGREAGRCG